MSYLSLSQIQEFNQNGFLVLKNFSTIDQIQSLKARMSEIIDQLDPNELKIFTTENQTQVLDRYFLDSAYAIRCFFEEDAFKPNGQLKTEKHLAINKVGHALHDMDDVFERFSYQKAFLDLAKDLGLEQPSIAQSQYIFKQARIGGVVHPHTDSTFLHTTPLSCLGAWLALEDATTQNGCLSFIPNSHKVYPLQQQYVMNKERSGTEFVDTTHERVNWDEDKLQPVEVNIGDLVLIHGSVVHASTPNHSTQSRHAYIIHMIDLQATWSNKNWLQRPESKPFRPMESVIEILN